MLKEERQRLVLELLQQEGRLHAVDLSARLQVSEDTIRRDLVELADAGKLQRVHGGALPRAPYAVNYAERISEEQAPKDQLARAALDQLRDGMVIILDGGTTTLSLARLLPPHLSLTVITNSPPIAMQLATHPHVEVIMPGGRLLKSGHVLIGSVTEAALAGIHADLCFLGICSLDPTYGITANVYEEATVKRMMMASADRTVALATAAKLGTVAPYDVAPARQLAHLVTQREASAAFREAFAALGVSITTA